MGKINDTVVGKDKQVLAGVVDNGKLTEEGKEQVRKSGPVLKPFGNLD
jgi:hypothetical protein